MNGIDSGTNINQYGTTAERNALIGTKPFTRFYDTDLSAEYVWHGRWDLAPTGGGGGGGGAVTIANTTASAGNVQIASLYYPLSTGNNTSTQLAAGATFTGNIETVLSLQAAQIEVVCDTAYTVVINQYIDAAGTQKSGSRTIARAAGVPMNINVLLPGNYFNLALTNNGASPTTTLAVNTTFGIMDSVDDAGRLSVNTPQAGPYTAQQRATASAVALPARALVNGIVITAALTNVGTIMVGGSGLTAANDGTGNGEALQPGVARSFAAENANQVFIMWATGNTTATDFVTISGN